MKNKRVVLFLLFILLSAPFCFSQQEDADSNLTIEQIYLQNIQMQIIREQAANSDRDQKLLALDGVEDILDAGNVIEGDPQMHIVLDYLSTEGVDYLTFEDGRVVNDDPIIRARAVSMLGRLSGENSRDTLLRILDNETEPLVLAEAVYQLGVIGLDEDDVVMSAVLDVLLAQYYREPDDNLAYSILLTVERFAEIKEGINDIDLFRAILQISQDNAYNTTVRAKAIEVLQSLRAYS